MTTKTINKTPQAPQRPALINLQVATEIATRLQAMGLTLVSVPLQGQPRLLGASSDKHTGLEIIGELTAMRAITVLAQLTPDADDVSRRNGELMRLVLDLVAPLWPSRGRWLVEAMQRFGRVHEQVQQHPERYKLIPARATLGYGNVELQYLHKTNQLSLRVRLNGGFHAALAT